MNPQTIAKNIANGTWKPDLYLTNVSIAHFQKPDDYVAHKLFPIVPVAQPMGKFYKFNKGDLARANMGVKPAFGSVAPAVFGHTEDSYSVEVYQSIIGIDQITSLPYQRAGVPSIIDPRVAKAKLTAEQTKLFMDMMFAQKFFKTGAWQNEYTGTGSAPSGKQFYQFDNANSDPIKFIDGLKTEMKREGRRTPNKLSLGANTYKALKNNPSIIERIKYSGSSANPAMVNQNVLAQLFGVDEVLVLESTYNTAKVGQETNMEYVCDENGMLLCYTAKSAAIDEPSAGYIFAWDMLGTGQHMATSSFMGRPEEHAEYVETLCSFDMKAVSQDMAVYCGNCVSQA